MLHLSLSDCSSYLRTIFDLGNCNLLFSTRTSVLYYLGLQNMQVMTYPTDSIGIPGVVYEYVTHKLYKVPGTGFTLPWSIVGSSLSLWLTLSARLSRADDRPKFSKLFQKISKFILALSYLDSAWKMHSNA